MITLDETSPCEPSLSRAVQTLCHTLNTCMVYPETKELTITIRIHVYTGFPIKNCSLKKDEF